MNISDMKNIVVLVSGGGTNLQALIDASERGEIENGRISCGRSWNGCVGELRPEAPSRRRDCSALRRFLPSGGRRKSRMWSCPLPAAA